MTNSNSVRLSSEFIEFSDRAQTNRVILEKDKKTIGHVKFSRLMVKYFKKNNDRYLELVNMENKENA